MDSRKLFRYLFMFLLTLVAVSSIAYDKLDKKDIITITMFVTLCFMFIDLYYPVVVI
jgi:heme/copper-type cytochrome/quinol oxidase subunit 4